MLTNYALFFTVLSLAVFAVEWLTRATPLRYLGSALLSLLVGSVLVNIGAIPSPSGETGAYELVLGFVAPMSIFYLILQVDLRQLREAGAPMLLAFALGVPGVAFGMWLGHELLLSGSSGALEPAIGTGMLIAGHIGGSANLNALAIHYDVLELGNAFVTLLAVDHCFIALWIGVTLILPRVFCATAGAGEALVSHALGSRGAGRAATRPRAGLSAGGIGLFLAAGFGSLAASHTLSAWFGALGVKVPVILLITVFGLALAQSSYVRNATAYKPAGDFLVSVFLLCIGAFADFRMLLAQSTLAAEFAGAIALMLAVHGGLVFFVGRLLRVEWGTLAVGSQACIGGPVSAAALAESIGRPDLLLPAVLVGSLGGALGTFAGFAAVALLT